MGQRGRPKVLGLIDQGGLKGSFIPDCETGPSRYASGQSSADLGWWQQVVTILEIVKEKLFMTPDKVGKEDFIYRGPAVVFCSRGERSGSPLITSTIAGWGQWMENDRRRHQGWGMLVRPTQ